MDSKKKYNLYFIALIPDERIRSEVKALKSEMRDRFGAGHALKSPAHITLIPPFKREALKERFFTDSLKRFSERQDPFSLELLGFGNFAPRVIYINVNNPDPAFNLHNKLCSALMGEMLFHPDELKSKIHPHMTLATRDLSPESYFKAWQEFKNREFNTTFEVKSVFLLKHNGKFWDIYREFSFSDL